MAEVIKTNSIVAAIAIMLLFFLAAFSEVSPANEREAWPPDGAVRTPASNGAYFSTQTVTTRDGRSLEKMTINGPPNPLPGYEQERIAMALPQPNQALGTNVLIVPAYDWVFGCSAVSSAMIAAYYDRDGFPEIYTGPTNGGVMPLESSVWSTWTDGVGAEYPDNPLVASHIGVDGRTTRGSIEDFWVSYGSSQPDPYITNDWTMHTWGEAIGDYMKTSQSSHENSDGATSFYNWTDSPAPLTCLEMESFEIDDEDGTYGRKQFYEARGYQVTDCYNQLTDNNGGGFTFAMFIAEIDAGRPVLLNLRGHSIVGIGYDDVTNTVFIHDTWDYNTHTMTWGGSYDGMLLQSVSIVNLEAGSPDDQYEENDTLDRAYDLSDKAAQWLSTILGYGIQADSDWYRVFAPLGQENLVIEALFSHSEGDINLALRDSAGVILSISESITDDELIDFTVPAGESDYFIEVYYGNQGNEYDLRWTAAAPPALPDPFGKVSPEIGETVATIDPGLSWESSEGVEQYEYCYDTSDDSACSDWIANGTGTSITLQDLSPDTVYYWHVRAVNSAGITYADDSDAAFWSFVTLNHPPTLPSDPDPVDEAVDQQLSTNLMWTGGDPDGDAVRYDVYFGSEPNPPELLLCDDISATTCDPGKLTETTRYTWYIVATDEHSLSSSGPVWSFTTLPPGDLIQLFIPMIIR